MLFFVIAPFQFVGVREMTAAGAVGEIVGGFKLAALGADDVGFAGAIPAINSDTRNDTGQDGAGDSGGNLILRNKKIRIPPSSMNGE